MAANPLRSREWPRMWRNGNAAGLVGVSCWMDGLVFDHEWALIHTNEGDLFQGNRANSCSFVVLKIESQDSTRMAANPLRSREWPRMWWNGNVLPPLSKPVPARMPGEVFRCRSDPGLLIKNQPHPLPTQQGIPVDRTLLKAPFRDAHDKVIAPRLGRP